MYYTGIAVYRKNDNDDLTILLDDKINVEYKIKLIITSDEKEANRFKKENVQSKLCLIVLSREIPDEISDIIDSAKKFLLDHEGLGIRIN